MPGKDTKRAPAAVPQGVDRLVSSYYHGGVATYLAGATFGPRTLRDYELVWIIQGKVTYIHDDVQVPAPPGTVILGRPGFVEEYLWDPHQTTRHAFVHFDIRRLPRDWPGVSRWPIAQPIASGDLMLALFREVVNSLAGSIGNRPLPRSVCRILEAMLDRFLARPDPASNARASPMAPTVRFTLDFVSRSLAQPSAHRLTLIELASRASVSPKHLCRLFQQSLSVSPMEAVRLMRLDQAMSLIQRSNLSIKEIAVRCGFASQYHFSRCFRQAYGRPPMSVRRDVQAGVPLLSSRSDVTAWFAARV